MNEDALVRLVGMQTITIAGLQAEVVRLREELAKAQKAMVDRAVEPPKQLTPEEQAAIYTQQPAPIECSTGDRMGDPNGRS